ncbi:MAG: serine hydrolase [Crocinitomicaceae bacterium]|nr:serine hydrolase [Crocinitomicaceae bacterium]
MKRFSSIAIILSLTIIAGIYLFASQNIAIKTTTSPNSKLEPLEVLESASSDWANRELSKLTLREKIGQFFMVAAYSNKGELHLKKIDSLVSKERIGGIIFFQGQRENLITSIDRFQQKAKVPLLIGMDAEWGVQMRLFGEKRFPYNYTIGAANDPKLTYKIAQMIGQECRELGIHMNFAPVADVNSNPKNPVIGFRSYGENPKEVALHVESAVKGMESQGVLTSIKHFPGHGDTDTDSHYELPIVNNTYTQINAIDFFPFRSGIRAGASSVMIGHLNVPALDPSGTPSSLSKIIIHDYLKKDLGFKGLIISDALGMKAVADEYGKTEVCVKAFQAGCDILLFPESVGSAIDAIQNKVETGEIDPNEINDRCKKILEAKYKSIVSPKQLKSYTEGEIELAKKQIYEKSLTVLKNQEELFPIKSFDQKIAVVSIGANTSALKESMNLSSEVDHFHFYNGTEAKRRFSSKLTEYDLVITTLHAKSVRTKNDYGLPKGWRDWIKSVNPNKSNALVVFGNPLCLSKNIDLTNIETVIVGYENNALTLDRAGQLLMGSFESQGKLPISVNSIFKRGYGLKIKDGERLKESQPEELGISPKKLSEIDSIVARSIRAGAFPGCQIVVAVKGNVIYRKSFGYHTYQNNQSVENTDLYDIASITKVAASTLSLMHMESEGKFNLDGKLSDYLPALTQRSAYGNINIKAMMSHQAGLKPWIPFYVTTLENSKPKNNIYQTEMSDSFPTQVSSNLWIVKDYTKKIYDQILSTPLNRKTYKYSDIGYYFIKEIIEKENGQSLDDYVENNFYKPMGLNNIKYNPTKHFPLSRILPTENDTIFRKEQVHGFVHDQGASMMGGVGGHAGLFSNASDLAGLMQLFLNKGQYAGVSYIDPDVVSRYTGCQFCPKNRRGAGFDKPTTNLKGGPTCNLVSLASFGHSGFTGTLVWADPVHEVNYVFLSNRVYPDAENWKIVRMNVRTDIQKVIYEAIQQAKR